MSASIPHLTHAHNIYLHILAEYGVIGMIGMTWLLWRLLNFTFMFTKSSLDDFYFHVTKRLWFTSFVFFCFTGLFATPLIIPKQFGYLMLLLAISMTWSREIHDPRPKG
jgi:O-antigen ligase